ncbi:unnamed protein product [Durusdinium trenchii]|uniref:DNA-directed RNA polymerase subunit n=2 Tax=Durusdinium trenchii TaxID=1381693 RepID=A0ABP0KF82_9DINO
MARLIQGSRRCVMQRWAGPRFQAAAVLEVCYARSSLPCRTRAGGVMRPSCPWPPNKRACLALLSIGHICWRRSRLRCRTGRSMRQAQPVLPPSQHGAKGVQQMVMPKVPAELPEGTSGDMAEQIMLPPLQVRQNGDSNGIPPLPSLPDQGQQARGILDDNEMQSQEGAIYQDNRESDQAVDYLAIRLQSPAEIRNLAKVKGESGRKANGQVLHPYGQQLESERWAPVPDGPYCERIFGESKSYNRREKTGYIELAWPSGHVWFSGDGKLGRAAQMLGWKKKHVVTLRQYVNDVFLGEWVAPRLGPLLVDPVTNCPKVPGIGSPVAAAFAPALRKMTFRQSQQDVEGKNAKTRDEESAPLSRENDTIGKLLKVACQELPADAASVRDNAYSVLAAAQSPSCAKIDDSVIAEAVCLGRHLRGLAQQLESVLNEGLRGSGSAEASGKTDQLRSVLASTAIELMTDEGLSREESIGLLRIGVSPETNLEAWCDQFQRAAREDFYKVWRSLAVPNCSGDLDVMLDEILQAMSGEVKLEDAAKAERACQKLLKKCFAALDLAVSALTFEPVKPSTTPDCSRLSRYWPRKPELCWYDPAMMPVAFHSQDVERLAESKLEFQAHPPDSTETASGKEAKSQVPLRRSACGLTTPDKHKQGASRQTRERAASRWHLPIQVATRPCRAGGLLPLPRGEVIESSPTLWAKFAATRPRPSTFAAPIPGNMEAEGSLYIGSGSAALRQVLCDIEPTSTLQRLAWDIDRLDDARRAIEKSPAGRLNLTLASVEKQNRRLGASAESTSGALLERREFMESAVTKHQLPEWSVLTSFPVLPPDLRLGVGEDPEERPDDLNTMYQDVLVAGRDLEVAIAERHSAGLLRYRKLLLQAAVDSLIDNGRVNKAKEKTNGNPFESVAKRLKGKQGRMRKNMLGKRVNFSARTVIVVDPELKLDECGLPFPIAKDIYEPFLLREIEQAQGPALSNARDLMSWYEGQPEDVQKKLMVQAMGDRPLLLNRAPTLHRLSMQAFRPRLVDGQALKIHPLVCSPFNADFDGDTMTIHLTLSEEAQKEAHDLMMPSRNLRSPAHGEPVIGPTQDMVLGLYYMTSPPESKAPEACQRIEDKDELVLIAAACAAGEVPHDEELIVPRSLLMELAPEDETVVETKEDEIRTTSGRILFFLMLHSGLDAPMCQDAELLQSLDDVGLVDLPLVN